MAVEYSTKDLPLAAYLWTVPGFSVEKTSSQSRTVFFHLSNPDLDQEGMKKIVFDYMNNRCSVDPKHYCQRMNDLRDLLHKLLDNPHRM